MCQKYTLLQNFHTIQEAEFSSKNEITCLLSRFYSNLIFDDCKLTIISPSGVIDFDKHLLACFGNRIIAA